MAQEMPPKGRVGLGGETNSTGEGPGDLSQEVRKVRRDPAL